MRLVVLGVPDRAIESIWSAYTFCFWHGGSREIEFAFDGEISDADRKKIQKHFPNSIISNARKHEHDELKYPNFAEFSRNDRFGRKLSLLINSTLNSNTIYLDNDILFFKEDEILSSVINQEEISPWFVTSPESAWVTAGPLQEMALAEGSPIMPGFNSGMMILPRGFLKLEEIEYLLSKCRRFDERAKPLNGVQNALSYCNGFEYFTEQSLFGLLFARSEGKQLPEAKYIHSNSGMRPFSRDNVNYDEIVMRHYFGTVRHQMYLKGMPAALRKISHRK